MANCKIIKPQHQARLFYSYWTGSAWSAHVEVTDTFLNDDTKSHVGSVSGLASLSDNLTEKDRFILYFGTYVNGTWTAGSGTLDTIAMAGLTQTSGLTFKVYGDDSIALGSVPTTQIGSDFTQVAGVSWFTRKNEILEFTETTKEVFMVERQGIGSYNAGSSAPNLLINGDFETGDFTGWNSNLNTDVVASSASFGNGEYYARILASSAQVDQTVTLGSGDVTLKLSFQAWTSTAGNKIDIDGGTTANIVNEDIVADSINEHTFSAPSSESTINIAFEAGGPVSYFDDVVLSVVSGAAYTGSPLDTQAIIFGGDAAQPTRNFENGATQDDATKFDESMSGGRCYLTRQSSLRKETLSFDLLSDSDRDLLEDLDKELNEGLCIYMRDSSSTDDDDWFIGRYRIEPVSARFSGISSMGATVTELVERV